MTAHPFSKKMAGGGRGGLILEGLFDNERFSVFLDFYFFLMPFALTFCNTACLRVVFVHLGFFSEIQTFQFLSSFQGCYDNVKRTKQKHLNRN